MRHYSEMPLFCVAPRQRLTVRSSTERHSEGSVDLKKEETLNHCVHPRSYADISFLAPRRRLNLRLCGFSGVD